MEIKDYFKEAFAFDLKAGFITAIVALPLAIAFAIASGVPPIMGLYTAVIAGILGSSFGGSRFSITGPTGAMTVIILATVSKFGIEGLLLAGFLAGVIQLLFGVIGFGKLVKYIPLPITTGFTAGIGAIIFIGQIANSLGLSIKAHEFIGDTISDILVHAVNFSPIAVAIALLTFLGLHLLPKLFDKIPKLKMMPPSLVLLVLSTGFVFLYHPAIPIVGQIPNGLPEFKLININFDLVRNVLPSAFTIALLGAIEALLCAVVCDAMTNSKHDSDKELRGQGIANLVLPFFGAIPSTAAVARSAVNIREGAKTKWSGVIHAVFILSFILVLGSAVSLVPKAFLAGILMFVSLKMIDLAEFKTVFAISKRDGAVLLITFGLTVITDLVFAVQIGMVLAIFLIFVRLSQFADISSMEEYDQTNGINAQIESDPKIRGQIAVYTIHGPFFFGAINIFERKINEHVHAERPHIIIRMRHVPFIDSTAAEQLKTFIRTREKHKGKVYLTSLQPEVKGTLLQDPEFNKIIPKKHLFSRTDDAIRFIRSQYASSS